jgi:MscS family membrane protein
MSAAAIASLPELAGRWLPGELHAIGPLELAAWQWLAVLVALGAAVVAGLLLGRLVVAALARIVRRSRTTLDDQLVERLRGPFGGLLVVLLWRAAVTLLEPPAAAALAFDDAVRLAFFALFFWAVVRLVGFGGEQVRRTTWARGNPGSRALIPLATRVLSALVVVVAVISMLSQLGYPVATLIAGLGIGGIAVALAAQKTVADLFGAFAIGVDQPLREGDLVRTDAVRGVVERIGLRSTRIRTADRTLVAVPNGKLADTVIETFAARDRIRFATTVKLPAGARPAAVRAALGELAAAVTGHPRRAADPPAVHLAGLGGGAAEIEVVAWFATTDWDEFCAIRDELLLRFLDVVERAGREAR